MEPRKKVQHVMGAKREGEQQNLPGCTSIWEFTHPLRKSEANLRDSQDAGFTFAAVATIL